MEKLSTSLGSNWMKKLHIFDVNR